MGLPIIPDRTITRRAVMTAVVLTLIILSVAALACGPAAPARESSTDADSASATPTLRWLNTPPSPSELATLEAMPTHTPYPPGYIKPTDPSALTDEEVRATRTAWITGNAAQQGQHGGAVSGAAEAATNTPVPTQVPLTDQVTEFVCDEHYDAIAYVRAGVSRTVTVPADVEWPSNAKPLGGDNLVRTPVAVVVAYHGELPMGYELVTPQFAPNAALNAGREYILFISKTYANENNPSECSNTRAPGVSCYSQVQIDAMGGPGGIYHGAQFWVVDGNQAWRMPAAQLRARHASAHLEAGRSAQERLTLDELEAAIRAGLQ